MLKTILFLFGSVFTFVAIIMCLIAFIIKRNSVKKRKNCSSQTCGIVVGHSMVNHNGVYPPIVEYEIMTKKFIEKQRFGLDDVVGGRTLSPYTTSNKQKEKETLIKRSVVYEQIDKKKSRILKRFSKYAVHDATFFTKFCFALTYFLKISAIIAAIINVICSFYQNDYYLLIMLIVSFGFTYIFSFIPFTYYYVKLTAEYRQRKKETIIFDNEIFKYAYDCSPGFSKQTIIFKIPLSKIKSCEYNEKIKQCVVKGDFSFEIYDDDKLVETNDDTCKMIDFFEVYDVEIYNLIRQNIRKVK